MLPSMFRSFPASSLHLLPSHWQIVLVVAGASLVLVAAILLAWKLDLFQRARIVRNQGEAGQASQPTEMEME